MGHTASLAFEGALGAGPRWPACLCAPWSGWPLPLSVLWERPWSPFLQGTWNGPWVSTEVLAAAIGLVIYYLAFSAKSHIQA